MISLVELKCEIDNSDEKLCLTSQTITYLEWYPSLRTDAIIAMPHTCTHTPHAGSSRLGCEVLPHFMFTLWSHCYHNLLSNTCLSQPLHPTVEGGGGPSGGSGSEGEKEVGCVRVCVCA